MTGATDIAGTAGTAAIASMVDTAGTAGMGGLLPSGSGATQQAITYPTVFLLVAFGSLVPVVPTGAVVSGAAVVALHQDLPVLALAAVFAIASVAAFAGDLALYWLGRRGVESSSGSRWLERLRRRAPPERLAQAQRKLHEHEVAVLVVSRLVPAGRVPVMLACLLARMRTREFVRGDVPACLVWAVTYQLIGLLSGVLFPQPWEGVAAAIALTLVVSAAPGAWRHLRPHLRVPVRARGRGSPRG